MDYTVHGIFQARILEWIAVPFSRGSSQPSDWTQISCIEGRLFTSWATGKPKNTGVGSLSLLQQIFLTQESNWGLLHCRQNLYQLLLLLLLKSLQSCPTLCDPIDGSPPGSAIPGVLQARTLEWVAISFSSARKWKVKVKSLSHIRLLATPWTAAYQAPPSMGFSRQEHWSGVPLPSPNISITGA